MRIQNSSSCTEKTTEGSAEYYEYSSAASIQLPPVPILSWDAEQVRGESRMEPFDLSETIGTHYPATSPNLLAGFVYLKKMDRILLQDNATSCIFYVIQGRGSANHFQWQQGDVFTFPSEKVKLFAEEDAILYMVQDSPLLKYLGVIPEKCLFTPTFYSKSDMEQNMLLLTNDDSEKNRHGILLGNRVTRESTKTITPTLWALYNKLPEHSFQKPHRHNSVAIDYCIEADGEVYTLIGSKLNPDGTIHNPTKMYWRSRRVFTTPPGLWHSHHNETDKVAYVLPLQDAGLFTYQQTLDIQFVK